MRQAQRLSPEMSKIRIRRVLHRTARGQVGARNSAKREVGFLSFCGMAALNGVLEKIKTFICVVGFPHWQYARLEYAI